MKFFVQNLIFCLFFRFYGKAAEKTKTLRSPQLVFALYCVQPVYLAAFSDCWWLWWAIRLHYYFRFLYLFGKQTLVRFKDLISKSIKMPLYLPQPSGKWSTNTDSLFCVDFDFWKEINKTFLFIFVQSLFYAMLDILSTPLVLWLK